MFDAGQFVRVVNRPRLEYRRLVREQFDRLTVAAIAPVTELIQCLVECHTTRPIVLDA
jgi:hypothetical protein